MKPNEQLAIGKKTALLSFLIGTIIIVSYYFSSRVEFAFVGMLFTLLAVVFNIVVFILLTPSKKSNELEKRNLIKVRRVMLINIPVMIIYFWFALVLMDNLRITFVNTTEDLLTNIEILGCQNLNIPSLKPNQSKIVWIKITGDCSVEITFYQNGFKQNTSVIEYISAGNGQKIKYLISQENYPLF